MANPDAETNLIKQFDEQFAQKARCNSQLEQYGDSLLPTNEPDPLSLKERNGMWQKGLRNDTNVQNLKKFDFKSDKPGIRLPTSVVF